MAKTKHIETAKIKIEYICPKLQRKVSRVLDQFDFSHSDSSCDLCGSHGSLTIEFRCKACNYFHEYEISSW